MDVCVQEEMREERSEGRKQADATRREQEVASAGGSGGQAAGSWRSRDTITHLATSRGIVPLLLSHSPLPLSVAWKPGTSSRYMSLISTDIQQNAKKH